MCKPLISLLQCYLDCRISSVFLQKQRDIDWVILGFTDDVMCIDCIIDFLFSLPIRPTLRVSFINTTDTSLASLYLCQLFGEIFSTRTSVPSLGRTMFQFALRLLSTKTLRMEKNGYLQVRSNRSLLCHIVLQQQRNHQEHESCKCSD